MGVSGEAFLTAALALSFCLAPRPFWACPLTLKAAAAERERSCRPLRATHGNEDEDEDG